MKFSEAKNGAKIHDSTHDHGDGAGVLAKKIMGFVVLEGGATVSNMKVNDGASDVRADYGADVALKAGAIIKIKEGSNDFISEVTTTAGQINYVPHLNSDT